MGQTEKWNKCRDIRLLQWSDDSLWRNKQAKIISKIKRYCIRWQRKNSGKSRKVFQRIGIVDVHAYTSVKLRKTSSTKIISEVRCQWIEQIYRHELNGVCHYTKEKRRFEKEKSGSDFYLHYRYRLRPRNDVPWSILRPFRYRNFNGNHYSYRVERRYKRVE